MKIGRSVDVIQRESQFKKLYAGFKVFAVIPGKEKELEIQNIFISQQCCYRIIGTDKDKPENYLRKCDKQNMKTQYIYNIELFSLPYKSVKYVLKKLTNHKMDQP